MIATTERTEFISHVEDSLQDLRRSNLRVGSKFAVACGMALFSGLLVIAITLDWYFGWLSAAVRWGISLVALSLTVATLLAVFSWAIRSRRQQQELAAQADAAVPVLQERLQTIVSVEESPRLHADAEMMNRVMAEAETLYTRVDPQQVVWRLPFRIPLRVVAGCGLLLVLMFVMQSRNTGILLWRFLWPGTSLTRTVVQGEFGDQVVAAGEPWKLTAVMSGSVAEEATLQQRMSDSETIHRTLRPSEANAAALEYTVARAKDSFAYRLTAGDWQSQWANVTVAQRPRIIGAELRVIPPTYTGRAEKQYEKFPRKLTVLQGSTVALAVRVEGKLKRAEWQLNPDRGARSMFATGDQWFHCNIRVDESVNLSPRLVEPHGLENTDRFELQMRAVEDKAPTVKILKPSPDVAVRPDDKVNIEFEARDDVGIQAARIMVYQTNEKTGAVTELQSIPIDVPTDGDTRRVKGGAEVDLSKFELKHGETISYRVDVYDRHEAGDNEAGEGEPQQTASSRTLSTNKSDPQTQPDSSTQRMATENDTDSQTATTDPATGKSNEASDGHQSSAAEKNERNETSAADSKNSGTQTAESSTLQSQDGSDSKNASSRQSSPNNGQQNDSANSDSNQANDQDGNEGRKGPTDQQDMQVDASRDTSTSDEVSEMSAGSDRESIESSDENAPSDPNDSQSGSNSQSNSKSKNNSSSSSQSESNSDSDEAQEDPDNQPQDTPDPGRQPTTRSLDVGPPPASSPTMQLKIDENAGSFEGQLRRKLEIAIAPVMENLTQWLTATDDVLASAQLKEGEAPQWNEGKQQSLSRAMSYLESSTDAIDKLLSRTNGTPYAFIGLQLSDIALTHIEPAQSDVIAALKTDSFGRFTLIDASRGQVQRALARLKELNERFEREKREQLVAEELLEFQKQYRVFIEDTLAVLAAQRDRINSLRRKGVEFEPDEEYLARLKEVLEMRRDLQAELARILGEDPRLLKRFGQQFREGADTLRDQFTLLARRQYSLTQLATKMKARESDADSQAKENFKAESDNENKNAAIRNIAIRTLQVVYTITDEFADTRDRFDTWLPLDDAERSAEIKAVSAAFTEAAGYGQRLQQAIITAARQLARTDGKTPVDFNSLLVPAGEFRDKVADLRQKLMTLAAQTSDVEITSNVANRLIEINGIRDRLAAWQYQLEAVSAGRPGEALAVDQHQLMIELHNYVDKMSALPQQLAALMQQSDGQIPKEINDLSTALLSRIDTGIEPTQLAAVLSLRKEAFSTAEQRMSSADLQFHEAEEIFDKLMMAVVEVMDELPVNDPIAELLDDPTLEEILANLERELPLNELLGIPGRPSNLQIINDWASPSSGSGNGQNGNSGNQVSRMLQQMMQNEQKQKQQKLMRLREHLVQADESKSKERKVHKGNRWSRLVSELRDGLLQEEASGAPEQYRSAIQNYFETISAQPDER